eukprot:TRINITY_DN13105_c0_g4_i2.p1 TRINITY_DN13105_c0_g4~~TRINITY_DN13105_c0_g4_i2.p1  ORF type:complete len:1759 (+),score=384.77 TRINITY_DN13105_c0_g4_i2:163-5439(+)
MGGGASRGASKGLALRASSSTLSTSSRWEPAWCPKTRRWYFQDRERGISTWETPADFQGELPPAPPEPPSELSPLIDAEGLLSDGWQSAYDPAIKRHYYFNRDTGVTTWTRPGSQPPLPPPSAPPAGDSGIGAEVDLLRRENQRLVREALEGLRTDNKKLRQEQAKLEAQARETIELQRQCVSLGAVVEETRAERAAAEIEARAELREQRERHDMALGRAGAELEEERRTAARFHQCEAELQALRQEASPLFGQLAGFRDEIDRLRQRCDELVSEGTQLPELRQRSRRLQEIEVTELPRLRELLGAEGAQATRLAGEAQLLRDRGAEESMVVDELRREKARLEHVDRDAAALHDALRILRRENERLDVDNVRLAASLSRPTSAGALGRSALAVEAPGGSRPPNASYCGVTEVEVTPDGDGETTQKFVAHASYSPTRSSARLDSEDNARLSAEVVRLREQLQLAEATTTRAATTSEDTVKQLKTANAKLKDELKQAEVSSFEQKYNTEELLALRLESKKFRIEQRAADNVRAEVMEEAAEVCRLKDEQQELNGDCVRLEKEAHVLSDDCARLREEKHEATKELSQLRMESRRNAHQRANALRQHEKSQEETACASADVKYLLAEQEALRNECAALGASAGELRAERAAAAKEVAAAARLESQKARMAALRSEADQLRQERGAFNAERERFLEEKERFAESRREQLQRAGNLDVNDAGSSPEAVEAVQRLPGTAAASEKLQLHEDVLAVELVQENKRKDDTICLDHLQAQAQLRELQATIRSLSPASSAASRSPLMSRSPSTSRPKSNAIGINGLQAEQQGLERTILLDQSSQLPLFEESSIRDAPEQDDSLPAQPSDGTTMAQRFDVVDLAKASEGAQAKKARPHRKRSPEADAVATSTKVAASAAEGTGSPSPRKQQELQHPFGIGDSPVPVLRGQHQQPRQRPERWRGRESRGGSHEPGEGSAKLTLGAQTAPQPVRRLRADSSALGTETTLADAEASLGGMRRPAHAAASTSATGLSSPSPSSPPPSPEQRRMRGGIEPRENPRSWRGPGMPTVPPRSPIGIASATVVPAVAPPLGSPAGMLRSPEGAIVLEGPVRGLEDLLPGMPSSMTSMEEALRQQDAPTLGGEDSLGDVAAHCARLLKAPQESLGGALRRHFSGPYWQGHDLPDEASSTSSPSSMNGYARCEATAGGGEGAATYVHRGTGIKVHGRALCLAAPESLPPCSGHGVAADFGDGSGQEILFLYLSAANLQRFIGSGACAGGARCAGDAPCVGADAGAGRRTKVPQMSGASYGGNTAASSALDPDVLQEGATGLLLGRGLYASRFEPEELVSRHAAVWATFAAHLGEEPNAATWRRWVSRVDYCLAMVVPRSICYEALREASPAMLHGPGRDTRGRLLPGGCSPWIVVVSGREVELACNAACHMEHRLRAELRVREATLGNDHADTIGTVRALARHLLAQSVPEKAEIFFRRSLAYDSSRGDACAGEEENCDDPQTLTSLGNLAVCLDEQGRHDEAEPLHRKVAEAKRRVFGQEHPATLASIGNLAACLYAQGDIAAAETLYVRALAGQCGGMVGPPNMLPIDVCETQTLTCVNNLAACISDLGKPVEAEPFFRFAVAGYERTLGSSHPDTLTELCNLASCLGEQGRQDEAEPLLRSAWESFKQVLGPTHARTLAAASSLASCLDDQGRHAEAEPLHRNVLQEWPKTTGSGALADPERILELRENLAECLEKLGRVAEAEALCQPGIDTTPPQAPA